MRPPRRLSLLAVGIAAAMSISSCGGGDKAGSPSVSPEETPSAQTTNGVVEETPPEQSPPTAEPTPTTEPGVPGIVVGTLIGPGYEITGALTTAKKASVLFLALGDGTEVFVPCAGQTAKSVKGKDWFYVTLQEGQPYGDLVGGQALELEAGAHESWTLAGDAPACPS